MLIQNYIQSVLSYLRYLSMFVSVLIIDLRVETCDVINTAIPSVRTECWLRKNVINVFIFAYPKMCLGFSHALSVKPTL